MGGKVGHVMKGLACHKRSIGQCVLLLPKPKKSQCRFLDPPLWISRVKSWGRLWEVRREGEAVACSPDYNTLSSQQVHDDLSISKFWAVTQ